MPEKLHSPMWCRLESRDCGHESLYLVLWCYLSVSCELPSLRFGSVKYIVCLSAASNSGGKRRIERTGRFDVISRFRTWNWKKMTKFAHCLYCKTLHGSQEISVCDVINTKHGLRSAESCHPVPPVMYEWPHMFPVCRQTIAAFRFVFWLV